MSVRVPAGHGIVLPYSYDNTRFITLHTYTLQFKNIQHAELTFISIQVEFASHKVLWPKRSDKFVQRLASNVWSERSSRKPGSLFISIVNLIILLRIIIRLMDYPFRYCVGDGNMILCASMLLEFIVMFESYWYVSYLCCNAEVKAILV